MESFQIVRASSSKEWVVRRPAGGRMAREICAVVAGR